MSLILSLDVDWAPDFMIDFVAERLIKASVKAVWFITHRSPALERLRAHPDLFELGIHPNFLPGSTHGDTLPDVLDHCLELVPEARCMRTHALVNSSTLLDYVMTETPILADSSFLMPHVVDVRPFRYERMGKTLLRVPIFWDDDYEMDAHHPSWHLDTYLRGGGLKVFTFHPVHVYLNSASMKPYQQLKTRVFPLSQVTVAHADPFIYTGEGAQTMFAQVMAYLAERESVCLRDLYHDEAAPR